MFLHPVMSLAWGHKGARVGDAVVHAFVSRYPPPRESGWLNPLSRHVSIFRKSRFSFPCPTHVRLLIYLKA